MDDSLENLLATQSFVLWVKGECSPREKEYWDRWLREDSERRQLVNRVREIVGAVHGEYDIPDSHVELERLNKEVDQHESQWEEDRESTIDKNNWWQNRGMVAAGLLILIALVSSIAVYEYYPSEKVREVANKSQTETIKEYNTGYGEKVTFRLSDGSEIILNANSKLRFSSKIEKGLNTEVWLEGEAYFNIAHLEGKQQRTFTVHTDDGSIQVLGTRFSVNTFDKDTQTALEQGKISIRIKEEDFDRSSSPEYVLRPGEMARFASNDNKIAIEEADTRLYTSWTKDKLFFKQTPMQQVAQRIEHTYGVEVIVEQKFRGELLTGTIRNDSLKVLTEALVKILETDIYEEDGKLHIGIKN